MNLNMLISVRRNEKGKTNKETNFVTFSYLDSFERDTFLCIEMEYADGGNLAQFLTSRTKRLGEKEILMIFHQICLAIRYMHEQSILHRCVQ